jgi:hypothetical protein
LARPGVLSSGVQIRARHEDEDGNESAVEVSGMP